MYDGGNLSGEKKLSKSRLLKCIICKKQKIDQLILSKAKTSVLTTKISDIQPGSIKDGPGGK